MVEIAVFDLNKTVYNKSSKEEFFKFICYRYQYKLANVFRLLFFGLLGKLHAINHTDFKENFFRYLDHLSPSRVQEVAEEFWRVEYPKYFNAEILRRMDELRATGRQIVIATGALEVYVLPLFDLLPVDYFCGTRTAYADGVHRIVGIANKEEEKLRRLDEYYGQGQYRIVEAYSDDPEAMLDRAERAFLVKDGKLQPYTAEIALNQA